MSEKVKYPLRLKKPASAGIWYTAISAIERGSAVVFTPIYTRLLLPEEYGIYSLFISFTGIVTVFATLEITGTAVYKGLREFEKEKTFCSAAIGLILLFSLISLGVYLLFSPFFNSFTQLTTYLTLILFLQVFLNGVRGVKVSAAKFSYNKRLPLIEGIFFSLFTPTLSIAFIVLFKNAKYAKIYAALLTSLIFAIPILFSVLKDGLKSLFNKKIWSFLLKHSLPVLPHFLSMSLIWQIGKITVANSFSPASAAFLSLAISVGLLPSVLNSGIQSAMIPWITRRLPEGSAGRSRIYSLLLSAFLPLCLISVLFVSICPELFTLLCAEEYSGALVAVYPISASLPPVFLSGILSSEISHYKNTAFVTLGSLSGMLFNLICNLLFTSKLGFLFSAILIPITFLVIDIVYFVILKLKFKDKELPVGKLALILSVFFILIFTTFFLRISFSARILFSISLIMLILPRIRDIKNLCTEG